MGLLDYILKRNPTDLLDYVSSYPGRVEEELKRIPRGFLPAAGAATASAITSPFIRDATEQLGGLLAPHVNRNQPPISLLLRGRDDDRPITGEELAPFLALGMGRPNLGRPKWFSPTSRALATAPPKGQPGQYIAHLKRPEQKGGVPGAAKEAGVGGLLGRLEEAKGLLSKEEVVSMWDPIELTETVRSGSSEPQMGAGGTYHHPDRTTATKYAHEESLNLPGGTNPKEILVQLPYSTKTEYGLYFEDGSLFAGRFPTREEAEKSIDNQRGINLSRVRGKGYEGSVDDALVIKEYVVPDSGYTGGHWSEPNVLAHIRTNERDVGGKKTLHIEEIQSDWHQQGQKKGYITETGEEVGLLGKSDYDRFYAGKGDMSDAEWKALSQRVKEWDERMYVAGTGVPDAPFKKNWHELAFKRALTEAVNDPSIERLTWTTGDVQADRYNLAKYIDSIEARAVGDNFQIVVKEKNGNFEDLGEVSTDNLADSVGKEMADKIVNDLPANSGEVKRYSGLDLEIGGEFHKQLYDGKIPRFAKKFLKKYGVEPKRFKPGGWEVFDPKTGKATNYFSTEEEASDWVADWNAANQGGSRDYEETKGDYWYIDITPEMRQDLWEMPLAMNNRKPFLAYA